MDWWSAVGIFLLGAGTGALVTAIFYSAQICDLKRLLTAHPAENSNAPKQSDEGRDDRRKSA